MSDETPMEAEVWYKGLVKWKNHVEAELDLAEMERARIDLFMRDRWGKQQALDTLIKAHQAKDCPCGAPKGVESETCYDNVRPRDANRSV